MHRHRISLLAAAAIMMLVVSACSEGPTLNYTVAIDPVFTADQIEAITGGIEDWTTAVPELHIASSITSCDAPTAEQVCIYPAFDAPDPTDDVIGSTDPTASSGANVWIYVNRIQATGWDVPSLTQQTVAHEMGHAVGLKHTSAGQLMAADVPDQAHTVTSADVAQFWAVRK